MLTVELLARLLEESHPRKPYDTQRAATVLYRVHVQGKKYREIAEELDISTSAVANVISTAEGKLRAAWPLYADCDVKALYDNESLRRKVWPQRAAAS